MNRISAKTVRIFVAGALALMGFQSLVWTPYYLIVSKDLVFVSGSVFSGLALWIGVAMFAGSKSAVWWAHVYLWLHSIGSVCMAFSYILAALNVDTPFFPHATWWGLSKLPTPVILLCLLIWSRSKRFGDSRTPNTALEPTPTAS